jgi:hypothetical protein
MAFHNGTVCTGKQDGSYRVQMITLTEKLMNLKYDLLMDYLDRDIRISRHFIIYVMCPELKILAKFFSLWLDGARRVV